MSISRLALPLLAVLLAGAAPRAHAIEPIPDSAGWRGFLVVGAGYTDVSSNLVAGNRFINIGRPEIDSIFQGPQNDDAFHPVFTGEINYTFGNYATFREKFTEAALTHFGSGWAWLVGEPSGRLAIITTANADNPLRNGEKPLLNGVADIRQKSVGPIAGAGGAVAVAVPHDIGQVAIIEPAVPQRVDAVGRGFPGEEVF